MYVPRVRGGNHNCTGACCNHGSKGTQEGDKNQSENEVCAAAQKTRFQYQVRPSHRAKEVGSESSSQESCGGKRGCKKTEIAHAGEEITGIEGGDEHICCYDGEGNNRYH